MEILVLCLAGLVAICLLWWHNLKRVKKSTMDSSSVSSCIISSCESTNSMDQSPSTESDGSFSNGLDKNNQIFPKPLSSVPQTSLKFGLDIDEINYDRDKHALETYKSRTVVALKKDIPDLVMPHPDERRIQHRHDALNSVVVRQGSHDASAFLPLRRSPFLSESLRNKGSPLSSNLAKRLSEIAAKAAHIESIISSSTASLQSRLNEDSREKRAHIDKRAEFERRNREECDIVACRLIAGIESMVSGIGSIDSNILERSMEELRLLPSSSPVVAADTARVLGRADAFLLMLQQFVQAVEQFRVDDHSLPDDRLERLIANPLYSRLLHSRNEAVTEIERSRHLQVNNSLDAIVTERKEDILEQEATSLSVQLQVEREGLPPTVLLKLGDFEQSVVGLRSRIVDTDDEAVVDDITRLLENECRAMKEKLIRPHSIHWFSLLLKEAQSLVPSNLESIYRVGLFYGVLAQGLFQLNPQFKQLSRKIWLLMQELCPLIATRILPVQKQPEKDILIFILYAYLCCGPDYGANANVISVGNGWVWIVQATKLLTKFFASAKSVDLISVFLDRTNLFLLICGHSLCSRFGKQCRELFAHLACLVRDKSECRNILTTLNALLQTSSNASGSLLFQGKQFLEFRVIFAASSFAEIESQAKQCAEISVNSHLNKLSMDPSSAISISEIICNLVEGGNGKLGIRINFLPVVRQLFVRCGASVDLVSSRNASESKSTRLAELINYICRHFDRDSFFKEYLRHRFIVECPIIQPALSFKCTKNHKQLFVVFVELCCVHNPGVFDSRDAWTWVTSFINQCLRSDEIPVFVPFVLNIFFAKAHPIMMAAFSNQYSVLLSFFKATLLMRLKEIFPTDAQVAQLDLFFSEI